jgi:hypothetical protein
MDFPLKYVVIFISIISILGKFINKFLKKLLIELIKNHFLNFILIKFDLLWDLVIF